MEILWRWTCPRPLRSPDPSTPHTARSSPRSPGVHRRPAAQLQSSPQGTTCSPRNPSGRARRRREAGFPPRNQAYPRLRLDRRPNSRRHPGPPRRDHRPRRPQDDHQRAQLRREGLHGRLRGLHHAHLGQPARRPDQPARRRPPHHHVRRSRQRQSTTSSIDKPAVLFVRPRGWHLEEKPRHGRRRADVRLALRLRALLLPQREGAAGARHRAPTSICPRWRATSRRGSGTTSSSGAGTSSASRAARSAPRC